MRNRSISLEERLKQAVSTEKVEETKVITKIDNICISEDENENKYLIEKTIEILNIQYEYGSKKRKSPQSGFFTNHYRACFAWYNSWKKLWW